MVVNAVRWQVYLGSYSCGHGQVVLWTWWGGLVGVVRWPFGHSEVIL